MESSVTILNFDGVYTKQDFYHHKHYEWVDLTSIPNTNLLCEKDTLTSVSERMSIVNPNLIYYLGSGNYHYASYLLQSKIDTPYTLILFDHHTDTLPSPSENLISCGSWVLELLRTQPLLKKVFIIGVSEDAHDHIPEPILNRVLYYTKTSFQSNLSRITKSILKNIPTKSVYVSLDKDVLDTEDAVTGWDHGTLRLKQVLTMLKMIFDKKNILGLDVCGEIPMDPTIDYQKEMKQGMQKNNIANRIILESVTRWLHRDDPTTALLKA